MISIVILTPLKFLIYPFAEGDMPFSECRNNLSAYTNRVRETRRPILLTQNGRASYVFMDLAAFEEIREKLEKMEAYEDLLVAEGEADRGEVYTVDEVERMMNDHIAKHVAKQPKSAAV